jgi:hypothetical protein
MDQISEPGGIKKQYTMFTIYAIVLVLLTVLVWLWVGGIDYMKKNHPDYKGEDFLDEREAVNRVAGREMPDENIYDEIY